MKRWALVIALLPMLAVAQVRGDYAKQWSIALPDADAGAYRVELDANVYRAITSPALRDVDVVDARGKPVAADVFGPDAPLASPPRFASVPWFVVRAPRGEDDGGLALIARRDPTGRILSVEAQVTNGNDAPAPRAFLLDLSRWTAGVEALVFDFPMGADVQAAFRVETSDDLQVWRTLHPRLQLLDLQQAGSRLSKNDIPLGMPAKYVRLVPLGDEAFAFDDVRARIATAASERTWAWETVQGREGRDHGRVAYEFESPGRFPVERADVIASGNAAVEWRLECRDDDDAPWTWRAGPWVAFRVSARDGATTSAPASIGGAPVRDRLWRMVAESGTPASPPALKLGYRSEVVVFLAQGTPPYSLVAGSARATRGDAPLPSLVDAMRASKGEDWQPMSATLGEATELEGTAALERRTTPEDWKHWLLWLLLVAGAALVAGFAITLLRKPPVR
jgi:hypothetical protein